MSNDELMAQSIVAKMRTMILTQKYPPGSELNQEKIAAEFNVSRTPVRQVLQVLAEEGLITLRKNRSAIVREQTTQNIRDHFELRGMLEAKAAAFAAKRGSDFSRLTDIIKRSQEAESGDHSEWELCNLAFHQEIWKLADCPKLEQLIRQVWNTPSYVKEQSPEDRRKMANKDHYGIYEAVLNRDDELASLLMHRHIVRRNIENFDLDT